MENGQLIVMENELEEKSYCFPLSVVKVYQNVSGEKREYALSKRLLRSGTALGALTGEADQAEWKPDFNSKLAIADKEANELIHMLTASIKTRKAKIGYKGSTYLPLPIK